MRPLAHWRMAAVISEAFSWTPYVLAPPAGRDPEECRNKRAAGCVSVCVCVWEGIQQCQISRALTYSFWEPWEVSGLFPPSPRCFHARCVASVTARKHGLPCEFKQKPTNSTFGGAADGSVLIRSDPNSAWRSGGRQPYKKLPQVSYNAAVRSSASERQLE